MTESEAIEALAFHAGSHEDIHSPRWEQGFLGSLRPYRGRLNLDAMKELEQCFQVLAPRLQSGDSVERETLVGFLYVIGAGQSWALHPEGMLRRNQLIVSEDLDLLTSWLAELSLALAMLIEGMPLKDCLGMLQTLKK